MKMIGNILGVLLVLIGIVWFLQGINVLPGSFMTGQIRWAVFGGLAFLIGTLLLVVINLRRRRQEKKRPPVTHL
jgi:membrane-bound ClpP family serine protease